MRFCGNCGAAVDPGVRTTGVCSACGTPIAPSGDILDQQSTPATLHAVRGPASQPAPPAPFAPSAPAPRWPLPQEPRPARRTGPALIIVLVVAVVALSTSLAALLSATRHGLASGQPAPTATSASPAQTAILATPTDASAASTTIPDPSPTPIPTPTDSPTPAATPVLSVNPTKVSAGVCILATVRFTIANTGGGTMDWAAAASDSSYQLDPASGTLAGSDPPQTVTASNINAPADITVTAPGADGSPRVVMISCLAASP